MTESDPPKLRLLLEGFDERGAYEAHAKGYFADATVLLPSGERFRVFFMEPARAQHEIELAVKSGTDGCVIENGLILVESVTRSSMEKAADVAYRNGFFDCLRPVPRPET